MGKGEEEEEVKALVTLIFSHHSAILTCKYTQNQCDIQATIVCSITHMNIRKKKNEITIIYQVL